MDIVEDNGSVGPALPSGEDARFLQPLSMPGAAAEDTLLRRLRRRKLALVLTFSAVAALVAAAFVLQTPIYRATASVIISAPDRMLSTQVGDTDITIGDNADIESQGLLLGSPKTLRQMLAAPDIHAILLAECVARRAPSLRNSLLAGLHLAPTRPCEDELADTARTVADLQQRLSIGVSGRSRVIDVTYASTLPGAAQAVANGVVSTFLASELANKLRPRNQAIDWLRAEAGRVSDRLKATELSIQTFLQAKGVVNGQHGPIASEQLTNLTQLLAQAESERAAAAGRMAQSRDGGGVGTLLNNRSIGDVKMQLSAVTARLAQLSTQYGSAAPQVKELAGQQASLQRVLSQEIASASRGAASDYQASNDRVTSLRAQVDELKNSVRGGDDAQTQVASLQRDAATDRDLYLELTRSLSKLETDRRLVTTNARLVNYAELPEKLFFPKVSSFALAGGLLATTAAVLVALFLDRADTALRAPGLLAENARLRVLAYLPHVSRLPRASEGAARRIQNSAEFQEAVRGLYAECLLLGQHERPGRPRSILFTSASHGEGKSTTALALALFSVAAGQRVLILEADLRQPSVARSLSLPSQPGLEAVLRGQLPPERAVQHCRHNLDVLPAGTPATDSTELLGSSRLRQVMAWAAAHYDLVLVDAPATGLLPDARILASRVDGVLFCARWGHSETDAVGSGIAALRDAGGRILGLVLNQVERSHYSLYDRTAPRMGGYLAAARA